MDASDVTKDYRKLREVINLRCSNILCHRFGKCVDYLQPPTFPCFSCIVLSCVLCVCYISCSVFFCFLVHSPTKYINKYMQFILNDYSIKYRNSSVELENKALIVLIDLIDQTRRLETWTKLLIGGGEELKPFYN